MKAITVKYLSPTNTKGTRVKASDGDGNSVILPKDYALDSYEMAQKAAVRLCEKMDWHGVIEGGYTKDGMVFVFSDGKPYKV
jgi:hypothetical protein